MIEMLLGLILVPVSLMLTGLIGYYFGVIIAWVPFIRDLLTENIGLTPEVIPTIMAWLYIFAIILYMTRRYQND